VEDATLKEFPEKPPAPQDSEVTLRYGAAGMNAPETPRGFIFPGEGSFFRGWRILEQLPTQGAEADIYLVQAEGERKEDRCVLKLYRHRLEPKLEVLNRVAGISRNYSRYFVAFKDVGFDETTGRWYELQEYIPLGSLRDIPSQAKRAPGFLRALVSELTDAIHCLHLNKIVHCDIKPANVLVRALDPLDLILTDFGIASILASDMSRKMTNLKGTPMYWAPEAFSRMIGRPCDWWGLGMIVLELLVGEHPFEGLTDSQIIRKLTLGNVEVPKNLGPDWALLIQGLLTKDDALRWGQAEVLRWLSGDRNIPVHYEEPAAFRTTSVKTPFLFEGREYKTPGELAQAFAVSQNPWFSGVGILREVRRWLESNMLFDEALRLGSDITNLDPELALFRFVHGSAECPFSLMGKQVDAHNLPLFLERVLRGEAWSAERRIVGMLGNGRLLSFYDEYLSLSGSPADRDSFFYRLLLFMNKKTPEEQWEYFEAMRNPSAYLWPSERHCSEPCPPELQILEKIRVVPLKRETFEELKRSFVLPHELPGLFRSASTYAAGVEWLEDSQIRDLLIPRNFAPDPSIYENSSLDGYSQAARSHWLGHTPALLTKLDFLMDALPALPCNPLESEILSRTIECLRLLPARKITHADSSFVAKAAQLYEKRREITRRRMVYLPIAAGGFGLVFCGLRFLSGNTRGSVLFWGSLVLMAMIGLALRGVSAMTHTPLRRLFSEEPSRSGDRRGSPTAQAVSRAVVGSMFLFFALVYFGVFTSYPYPFSFLVGGIAGGTVCYGLDRRALSKNAGSILEACGSYCVSMTASDNSKPSF
jgi:serine/threonine protein kinase